MVVVDRAFSGAAAQATLLTAMTPSSPTGGGTITVSDDSGYPTSGKFEIVIDRGQNNEENVLINSRSGTTFTIGTRGYDGSVAGTHTSGVALVEHDLSGRTVQLFVDHVDDVEAAPHASKLPVGTTAGHDVEARHTFGAALGTPVTPTALTPDIAGNAGTGNNPAREDHAHNVPAATATSITGANAEGSSSSFARADHDHDLAAGTVTIADILAAARNILQPPGSICAYGAAAAPTGWILCNGAAVSRSTFATLFGVISTTYGVGDGSTTFNVPDLRQRFPLGLATAGTGSSLGGTGGAIDHTHTIAHTHDLDTTDAHAQVTISGNEIEINRITVAAWTADLRVDGIQEGGSAGLTTAANLAGDTAGSSAANSGTANAPFQAVTYIICTGNTT